MIFLTVNDSPSGVYKSQVIDVLEILNGLEEKPLRLVALISVRDFWKNRRTIKKWYSNSSVYPMFPGLKNWKRNSVWLRVFGGAKDQPVIARGPMAYSLAHRHFLTVVYDGRGAVKAELEEFPGMIPDKKLAASVIEAERHAVLEAKHRIAVSQKLVDYWRSEYQYTAVNHVVIPCAASGVALSDRTVEVTRQSLGFADDDIILVYSGGAAGWQSFGLIDQLIDKWLDDSRVKVLFLSPPESIIDRFISKRPKQSRRLWVKPEEVSAYLSVCDYGLLIRDQNRTNAVASPVKFAEYLAAGLKVLISPSLGDYSDLVGQNQLGTVVRSNSDIHLVAVLEEEKRRLRQFADAHLTKAALLSKYQALIKAVK